MIYDIDKVLLTHRGEEIKDGDEPVTFGKAVEQVLIAGGNPQASAEDKIKQYRLAQRIAKANGRIEFSAEEVAKIKELAAPFYSPVALGSLYDLLEAPEKAEEVSDLIGEGEALPTG